jgi:alkyl hydroperoxide reductase subunit AhpF
MDESTIQMIVQSAGILKKPVRLILFVNDVGCETCPEAKRVAQTIKKNAPLVALEIFDQVMDRDKTQLYGIKRVPAMVVQDNEGHSVTFYGLIEDVFFSILIDALHAASEKRTWFPEDISSTLRHLARTVHLQVFVETDCPLCRPVAQTAIGLALESTLVSAEIIIASDYPELIKKHSIKTLPKTIFGENLHMDGHVTESEFLEMIFQAEGLQPGQDRRCLVCSNPSDDIICKSCKSRIQAESLNHKIREERSRQISSS